VRYLGDQVGLKCFCVRFEDGGSMNFSAVEIRNRLMPVWLRKNWLMLCSRVVSQCFFTLWSLSRNWVSIVRELRSLPPSSMCTLWILLLHLSIPFQYYYQLSSGAGFKPSLQPSWSPLIFPFLFAVEELYSTRIQSGSFSLINVGSGFHCLRSPFFFLFLFSTCMKSEHIGTCGIVCASI